MPNIHRQLISIVNNPPTSHPMYICETCGKEFGHRGDFIKHVEVRKSPCVRDTKSQALIDRLAAMEKAMNTMAEAAGIKLNVEQPIQQQNNMSFPLSKTAFDDAIVTAADIQVGKDIADKDLYKVDDGYFNYLKDFIKANGLDVKYNEAGIKKLRRHADLDDIIKLYSVYDAMNALPAGTKIASKQSLLTDYFGGKFNKNTNEIPQIAIAETIKVEEVAILPSDSKEAAMLKTMFARFEQMLYNEGTVGTKAREDIIDLMILRMLEPYFENNTIDILDIAKYAYDEIEINQNNVKYVMLSNLSKLKTEEVRSELKRVWNNVLCVHPLTKQIFSKEKFLNIKSDSGLYTMIFDLCAFNFENCPIDILGNVYEHFIHKQFKGEQGSKLGQHFTPRKIVQFIVDNYSYGFGGADKFIDPFSGTGGFIMCFYEKIKNINQNSADAYLYSSEIDPDVFKYAKANSLIYTKKICPHVVRANAFEPENKNTKFERILTNPPFGMKFTDKDSYNKTTWFNQAKIKNGNMVCLQYNMHILAPGGICSMVWPFGSECFSTSKKTEIEIRKRLFTEFDVISVIVLPKGVFEYTSIATVIITFRKPIQGEIIVPKLKIYQYKDGAKTVEELEILADVGSDKLREKKFAIDPNAYKEMVNMNNIRPIFEIKKLGELTIIKHGNFNSRDMDGNGDIPFYSCSSKNPVGTNSKSTVENGEHLLLLSSGGSENNKSGENVGMGNVYYINGPSAFTGHVFSLVDISKFVSAKYLFHYLRSAKDIIVDMAYFTANLGIITKSKIEELPVPIPPMEIQNEIVSIVERFEAGISSMQESIKGIEFQIEMLSKKQFAFKEGEFEMKKLEDVCDFKNGTAITVSELKGDKYPVIGGGKSPMGRHNESNTPANTILVSKDGAYAGYVAMYDSEVFATGHCIRIYTKNVDNKFVYYFLKYVKQDNIYGMQTGAAQPGINSSQLKEISIPIPLAEIQQKFIEYYVNKESLFEQKKQNIETIKIMIDDMKTSIKDQFE